MPTLTTTNRTAPHAATPCPACGGLQCLCRPRFFAGQLLTEEDLNRLDRYIVEKNKLHNRYLHGWGVVCGLEVVCHPCDGFVTVNPGYALSPCGEDIVVCQADAVNVCDLIDQCREAQPRWECEPMRPRDDRECPETTEEWLLTIRYDEKPSRGITALRGGGVACCSRCSCGGSSACSCGCHEKTNGKQTNTYRPAQPKTPPQCEPTLTCEGYGYDACPAPQPRQRETDSVELLRRLRECLAAWAASIPPLPQQPPPTTQVLQQWCHNLKASLRGLLATHGTHDCRLDDVLRDFDCAPLFNEEPQIYRIRLAQQFAPLAGAYVAACFCSTLLPPCPEPVEDPRVVLATITVRKDRQRRCSIVKVCNWDRRRLVLSAPLLAYWFASSGVFEQFQQNIARVCCQPQQDVQQAAGVAVLAREGTPVTSAAEAPNMASMVNDAFSHPERQVSTQTLFLGVLGATDEKGQSFMTEDELRHPAEFLLAHQFVAPLLRGLLPQALTGGLAASDASVNELKAQMTEMNGKLQEQWREINELKKHKK